MLKMNAGEQSFNHMPFIIDYINELIVQLDYNIQKQTKYHIRGNEVMKKNFLIFNIEQLITLKATYFPTNSKISGGSASIQSNMAQNLLKKTIQSTDHF